MRAAACLRLVLPPSTATWNRLHRCQYACYIARSLPLVLPKQYLIQVTSGAVRGRRSDRAPFDGCSPPADDAWCCWSLCIPSYIRDSGLLGVSDRQTHVDRNRWIRCWMVPSSPDTTEGSLKTAKGSRGRIKATEGERSKQATTLGEKSWLSWTLARLGGKTYSWPLLETVLERLASVGVKQTCLRAEIRLKHGSNPVHAEK